MQMADEPKVKAENLVTDIRDHEFEVQIRIVLPYLRTISVYMSRVVQNADYHKYKLNIY